MSKVILKISFKHPNMKKTPEKNVMHLNYIASRPGVDKTLTENDLKLELSKEYSSVSLDNADYAKYIHQRPQSHGLFGPDGVADLNEVRKEIMNTKGYVWRCIISVREEDAKNVGYLDKSAWQDMLRNKVPDLAREMKIPLDNLRWVAAVHMEKGHPHSHVLIWEKDPQIRSGVISPQKLNKMRKILADEIFAAERFALLQEKNIMRDLIRDMAKDDITQAAKLVREVRSTSEELRSLIGHVNIASIYPKLYSDDELYLADQLQKLASIMPCHGRIAFKYMPQDVKEFVLKISDELLSRHEFAANLERNLKAVEELTKIYTSHEKNIAEARARAYEDIRIRICQILLKGAVESQKINMIYVDQDLARKAVSFIDKINNGINNLVDGSNSIDEKVIVKNLATTLLVSGVDPDEAVSILLRWNTRSASNIDPVTISKVVEMAYEKYKENNLWGNTTVIAYDDWRSTFKCLGVSESLIPKWIFKSYNWTAMKNFLGLSIVNQIWKSAWNVLERERMRTYYQAELAKRNQIQRQAATQNKSAFKETIRKAKDRSGYDLDDF